MKQGRNLLPQGLINANKQEVYAGDCISWCQDEWNGVLIDCKTDMVAAIFHNNSPPLQYLYTTLGAYQVPGCHILG